MATSLEAYLLSITAQLGVPVTVTPITTATSGTVTSGTTETFDAVLGYYQVNLVAGRRYVAIVNNLIVGATVAGDLYTLRIRNSGSSSNPTSASTAVALSQWYAPASGGTGEEVKHISGSFIAPTTGTNTFGLSAQRANGTGTFTPLSGGGTQRELYVMYLGAV